VSVVVVSGEGYLEALVAALPADIISSARRFTAIDLDAWPPRGMTTIMLPSEIKGLENDHVIVIEGDDLADDALERRSGMYVGMTRGRVSLRGFLRRDMAAVGGDTA
jgi:DNA helicase IV